MRLRGIVPAPTDSGYAANRRSRSPRTAALYCRAHSSAGSTSMPMPKGGPTSHIYFSQRLRLHYVDWGNPSRAAAAARARRPRPLPQLGLGGAKTCAASGTSSRPICAATAISGWSLGGIYAIADYVYDLAQLIEPARSRRRSRIIGHSLGGIDLAELHRPLSRDASQARRDRRHWARRRPCSRRCANGNPPAHARVDRAGRASSARPPAAPLRLARRSIRSACRKKTRTCRPTRRGT